MGRPVVQYIAGKKGTKYYVCKECKRHLAAYDSIISKAFQGQSGQAYLFESAVNVTRGQRWSVFADRAARRVISTVFTATARWGTMWMHTRKSKVQGRQVHSEKARMSARGIDFLSAM